MNNTIRLFLIACLAILLIFGIFGRLSSAQAQAGSAGELIAAVNAYRSDNDLEPYTVDGGLMSLAQSHSEYQASIETCTHTREDGSGPGAYGISAENIACGVNLSVQDAIYFQWADTLHTSTILGPDTGLVGAGMALVDNKVYYTLAVKRLSGDFNFAAPVSSENTNTDSQVNQAQETPISGIAVSTPNEDGSIAHIVQYGETLINIASAYGLTLADLVSINKLDPNNPAIFERQVLLIQVAYTPTPFITSTYTPRPPTRTPLPTRTPRPTRTATEPHVPMATWTNTPQPLFKVPDLDDLGPSRPIVAYGFIVISALGLIWLIMTSFLPKRK